MQAGWWVATFSSIVTLLTVAVGFVGDARGFRRILIVAFGSAIVARGIMALAPTRTVAIVGLMAITLMFQHAFMTFPKYVTREIGAAYPFGKVWAINPISGRRASTSTLPPSRRAAASRRTWA